MKDKMSNHIEEYFTNIETNQANISSKELFNVDEDKLDFKTEVTDNELRIISNLYVMDNYLNSIGMPKIFEEYYIKFLRLVISKNRKSREEYININKTNNDEDTINRLSDFANITGSKQ